MAKVLCAPPRLSNTYLRVAVRLFRDSEPFLRSFPIGNKMRVFATLVHVA